MNIYECFSSLVVAGEGYRCSRFKQLVNKKLSEYNLAANCSNGLLLKFGRKEYPEEHKNIQQELGKIITGLSQDIPIKFFWKG